MTESIYNTPATTEGQEEISSYKDLLVGEGKKYRDEEILAKAAYDKDQYISSLHRELKELRTDLNERANLEELVKELKHKSTSTSASTDVMGERHTNVNPQDGTVATPAVTKESIAEIVKSLVTESKTQDIRERNIDRCVQELKKAYGDNYVSKLEETSRVLGLGKGHLDNLAATSPEALLRLVGAPAPKVDVTAPRTSVTSNLQAPTKGGKDWAYYENLRRTDKRTYFTPAVQNEIHSRVLSGDLVIPSK